MILSLDPCHMIPSTVASPVSLFITKSNHSVYFPLPFVDCLKILQDEPILSQFYIWPVCNVRLPELCRTAVFFREMSLSELTPSFFPHSLSWCHCVLQYLQFIFLYSYIVSILAHLLVNCHSHCNRNHMHPYCCLCQMLSNCD